MSSDTVSKVLHTWTCWDSSCPLFSQSLRDSMCKASAAPYRLIQACNKGLKHLDHRCLMRAAESEATHVARRVYRPPSLIPTTGRVGVRGPSSRPGVHVPRDDIAAPKAYILLLRQPLRCQKWHTGAGDVKEQYSRVCARLKCVCYLESTPSSLLKRVSGVTRPVASTLIRASSRPSLGWAEHHHHLYPSVPRT